MGKPPAFDGTRHYRVVDGEILEDGQDLTSEQIFRAVYGELPVWDVTTYTNMEHARRRAEAEERWERSQREKRAAEEAAQAEERKLAQLFHPGDPHIPDHWEEPGDEHEIIQRHAHKIVDALYEDGGMN